MAHAAPRNDNSRMIGRSGQGALAVLFTPRAIRELLEAVTWWRKNRPEASRLGLPLAVVMVTGVGAVRAGPWPSPPGPRYSSPRWVAGL